MPSILHVQADCRRGIDALADDVETLRDQVQDVAAGGCAPDISQSTGGAPDFGIAMPSADLGNASTAWHRRSIAT